MNFATFVTMTVDGLAQGAAFSAFALALVLIWRATRVVNFAQGAMAAASAYIAVTVIQHTGSFWLGLVAALVVRGHLRRVRGVERHALRQPHGAAERGHRRAGLDVHHPGDRWASSTARTCATRATRSRTTYRMVADIGLPSDLNIFTFVSVTVMVVGLILLFSRTKLGLRLRASAFAPEVSRLLGRQRVAHAHGRLGAGRHRRRARGRGDPADLARGQPERDGRRVRHGVHRGRARRAGLARSAPWSAA